jgi:hypothetical protein
MIELKIKILFEKSRPGRAIVLRRELSNGSNACYYWHPTV